MKIIHHTCKFCRKPLELKIEDGYDALSDPHKLIPMACCDRCADYRQRLRRMKDAIGKACWNLTLLVPKDAEGREGIRNLLLSATRKLAELVARHHRLTALVWNEEFAQILMDRPHRWHVAVDVYITNTVKEFKPKV